jgi:hypothetical protein
MESIANTNMAVITDFTTVYPTDFVQATLVSSVSSTIATSLPTSVSSSIPESTHLISSLVVPSQTSTPTSSPTGIPLAPKPKFNDTFVIVILSVFILFAILLIAMVSYLFYLRYKGQCSQCQEIQRQILKWESGELKRITPQMVMKRDVLNKTPWAQHTSSELDMETGYLAHRMSRASTIYQAGTKKKPSLFQTIKTRIGLGGKPLAEIPDSPAGYNAGCLYSARSSAYPASSAYYQPEEDVNGLRVFTDVSTSDSSNVRGPLRKESNEPKRYTAYAPTDHEDYSSQKEYNVATALAKLESREYEDADTVLNHQSATHSGVQRALGIFSRRDPQAKIALHPNLYSKVDRSLYQAPKANVLAQPGEYQVLDWRRKGRKPPDLDGDKEDVPSFGNNEPSDKRKSM